MKILIAEDDRHIREGLVEVLEHEGYQVIAAEDGAIALEYYTRNSPDFILLDIMMPKLDGYRVCREIRKQNEQIPIVFLSAKDDEIDRVVGLELGADDYISKPFGLYELRARIKTIARRCLNQTAASRSMVFSFGDLQVDPHNMSAQRGEQIIELSLREIKILQCLHQHKNQVVSRDTLFDHVWGYDFLPNSRTLDQHISKLRKLIERDANQPTLIKTVHGCGYRYNG